jgi:membrane fusion protein (multidrug efflux system)
MNDKLIQPNEAMPAMRGNSRRRFLLLPVALLIILGGVFFWLHGSSKESTDDAQIDGHIHDVAARVGGPVRRILVENNQYVEAGTILVELDKRDYEVALAKAKADLAEAEAEFAARQSQVPIVSQTTASMLAGAKASVDEARASVQSAEQQIVAAEARLRSAEAMLRSAESNHQTAVKDLERYKTLVAKEEISQQLFDTAATTANSTEARLEVAKADLQQAQQGIAVARSELTKQRARLARAESDLQSAGTAPQQISESRARADSTSATVESKKAEVEQAQLDLNYTIVKAPVSGIVSKRSVELGELVQAGQPLLAVVPLEDVWVTANFKESQLAHMKPGQPVQISVDAYSGKKYQGHVESIAAATGARFSLLPPENATGNYVKVVQRIPVKILLEKDQNSDHLLRPGMSVVPTVDTTR